MSEQGPSPHDRPVALVVDDFASDRRILSHLAASCGYEVHEADTASRALDLMRTVEPDLLLLDIWLPDRDGLSVLAEVRDERPFLPVVIVTASDDEEHVREALNLGAVNFVRKPITREELGFVLERIYQAVKEEADLKEVVGLVRERRTELEIDSDPRLLSHVVSYLGREVAHHYPGYRVPLADLKLALYEALANALEHGNLEIDYDEKTTALQEPGGLERLIAGRRGEARFAARRIRIQACYHADTVEYRIRDEGRGFDPSKFRKDHALKNTTALHGRGLALIRHYMDEVSWRHAGSEIRLLRRLERRPDRTSVTGEQTGRGPAAAAGS